MTKKSYNGMTKKNKIKESYPILSSLIKPSSNKRLNTIEKNFMLLDKTNKNLLHSQKIRFKIIKLHLNNFLNQFDDNFDDIDNFEKFCIVEDILNLKHLLNKI